MAFKLIMCTVKKLDLLKMFGAKETRRDYSEDYRKMDACFHLVESQILAYQSATTGLYPVSTTSGNGQEGHVRDSTYCAITCWSLHLAYRNMSNDGGRGLLLGQAAVKTMRGILQCWMRQARKLADFNLKQGLDSTLHSKFNIITGDEIEEDSYPHLQMDCISLYLITLLQMIQSGLKIIFDYMEVDFVQNLVFYVERNYRIADYGMWERGSKQNNGTPELNASSVGFAKSLLETANGANLFGIHGTSWSVLFTDSDAHMRNRMIFESLLPRESRSKPVDAALLPTLSWPAFAVHDPKIKRNCFDHIKKNLMGEYGMKRYLQDGYGTQIEDRNRQHYLSTEVGLFQGIECEWPFLLYYCVINHVFDNDNEAALSVFNRADELLQKSNEGDPIVVRYYYVAEKLHQRNSKIPPVKVYAMCKEAANQHIFLWGQALYVMARMMVEGILSPRQLDPLCRSWSTFERPRWSHRYTSFMPYIPDQVVQVVVIAETIRLHQVLSTYGIQSQTPSQVDPIRIWSPNELKKAFTRLGVNQHMDIHGRPARPIGCLGTSKVYSVNGETVICYPLLFEINEFYLSQDIGYVVNEVQHNLDTISKMWKLSGRPTYTLLLREELVTSPNAKELISLIGSMKTGVTPLGTKVKLVRVQNMVTSAAIEHLDFLKASHLDTECVIFRKLTEPKNLVGSLGPINFNPNTRKTHKHFSEMISLSESSDEKLTRSVLSEKDLFTQCLALRELRHRHGPSHRISEDSGEASKDGQTVDTRLCKILRMAGGVQDWSVVRFCSGICQQTVDSLAPSIMTIIVSGKQMSLGVFGKEEVTFDRPLSPAAITQILYSVCGQVDERHAVLQQEMIINLGKLCETSGHLFENIHKIRLGWLVKAIDQDLSDSGCSCIFSMSPSEVYEHLIKVLTTYDLRSPMWLRRLNGCLGRVPDMFYERVWQVLVRAPHGITVCGGTLKQQPTLSDMSREDVAFRNVVEDMLSSLGDPVYRQIIVETLMVIGTVLERNPEVAFQTEVKVEELLNTAVKFFAEEKGSQLNKDLWQSFYNLPLGGVKGACSYVAKAVFNELLGGQMSISKQDCLVM